MCVRIYLWVCAHIHAHIHSHISYVKGEKKHLLVAHLFHSLTYPANKYGEPTLLGVVL